MYLQRERAWCVSAIDKSLKLALGFTVPLLDSFKKVTFPRSAARWRSDSLPLPFVFQTMASLLGTTGSVAYLEMARRLRNLPET